MALLARLEARLAKVMSAISKLSSGEHSTLRKHIHVSSNCCRVVHPSNVVLLSSWRRNN